MTPAEPSPVKLVVVVRARRGVSFREALETLSDRLGPMDFLSEPIVYEDDVVRAASFDGLVEVEDFQDIGALIDAAAKNSLKITAGYLGHGGYGPQDWPDPAYQGRPMKSILADIRKRYEFQTRRD